MKKIYALLSLTLLLSLGNLHGEGPRFSHKDPITDREFDNVYQDLRSLRSGTLSLSGGTMTGDISMGGHEIEDLPAWDYRRPELIWISVTTVDVATNTATANTTKIFFRDGKMRTVTENTSSANQYRRLIMTSTAVFTSGTEDSGIRSGESEGTNKTFAIYAVKSQIDSTKFVLVATTAMPIVSEFSNLDTYFGSNGWVYLGLIVNGDNISAVHDILRFQQSGNMTILANSGTGSATNLLAGKRLANTAGATSLTYTYSEGTGTTDLPGNIRIGLFLGTSGTTTARQRMAAATSPASAMSAWTGSNVVAGAFHSFWFPAVYGISLENASGVSIAQDIHIAGWIDNALGVGVNP